MGFFSGLTKTLFGGSDSSSQNTSASGFSMLPPELQKAFKDYATQVSTQFAAPQAAAFTPLPQTSYETQALGSIQRGTAPTPESLKSDISMLMNPFDEYVINDINRQAAGQGSVLNTALQQAGQLGSNRSMLGASDIEQQRLNQIGQFRQNQYNQAINQSLGQVAGLRQQDISNQLGAGGFLRGLDLQTKQAPFAALQSYGGMLGAIPQSGGSYGQGTSTSDSRGGISDFISAFTSGRAGGK